jgi:carbon monoxide dehydrogenase subunit G
LENRIALASGDVFDQILYQDNSSFDAGIHGVLIDRELDDHPVSRFGAGDDSLARYSQSLSPRDLPWVAPPGQQHKPLEMDISYLGSLSVKEVQFLPRRASSDAPVATLRGASLRLSHLPADFGEISIQLDSLDGYDDNKDGIIDGFGLTSTISLSDVDLSLGGETLLAFSGMTLGINELQIRPLKENGIRTGELVLDATDVAFLPSLASLNPVNTLDPRVGSIDLQTGAFSFAVDLPQESRRSLAASGLVPFQVTRVEGAFDPSGTTPDVSFALSGFFDVDNLVDELGTAIGSPNLAVQIEAYDASSQTFTPVSASDPLMFGVSYVSGEFRLSGTPALKANVQNVEIDLGSTLGELTLDGFLAVGGFDSFGLPTPMPSALGSPFAGQQVAGSLTVVSTSGIGALTGQIEIGGSIQSTGGISQLDLVGQATLEGDLSFLGVSGSGSVTGQFAWPLIVDNSTGAPSFTGTPVLLNLVASTLVLEIQNVVRFSAAEVTYVSSPGAGEPVATATGATVTLLGVLEEANLSGSADLELFDDNGDGLIDGVRLGLLSLTFAPGQAWDYESSGAVLLRALNLTATLDGIEYRPALAGFQTAGSIQLSVGELSLYPDGNGAFSSTVSNVQGSINPGNGQVSLNIGELFVGLGPDQLFQFGAANVHFLLDDDDATDIFSVETASLTILDDSQALSSATFSATDLRFNLVGGLPKFGLGGVQLEAAQGVLGTLGLAGLLPLDLTAASLSFASEGDGYTDFTDFTLLVDGFFNLSLIESFLPFEPILSIGETSATTGGNPHTFTGVEIGFDVDEGRITPINLANIRLGFSEWAIGELIFAGEMVFAGYVNGQLDPTVSGSIGIDIDSADNKVQPSGGTGFDFHGAEIALAGSIEQSFGVTTIIIDAQVTTTFDLKLGDFLELSDLGFSFGVDITATDDFLSDPLNLVDVQPRLEQMTVGSLTAGVGDYFSLGAVPGSGGGPGLVIDFNPGPGEPLVVLNFQVQSPVIGLSGTVENLAILASGVPDFAAIDQISVELVSRGDGSPSLLQDLFAEFLPLSVSKIGFKFEDGFFALDDNSQIVGIDDPTAINLIVSGRAGTPSWMPEDFLFEVGSDFSNLELDVQDLLAGQFPIVSLGGLGFEVGIDLGAFKIGGGLSVGVIDADPTQGVANVYYLAVEGGLVVAGYGATGAIAMTTAGPVGVTLSVPLAIPLAQSGFMISGAAGTIQFGTSVLPAPEDIQRPSDLGAIPNPFSIDLTSIPAIENIIHGLWDETQQIVRPTWTEPVTLALQGELTHVAVAGMISGTATIAANITLPIGGTSVTDGGLALLGFGELQAMGIPMADAKIVFDLRDELNPSFGFYIQAPAYGNPLGMVFPAQADFGVLLRTDGLAMATAIGLRAMFTELAAGAMEQGQLFFETVSEEILNILQQSPGDSALAEALAPFLQPGQSFQDLDRESFVDAIRDALELDDVLTALAADGGQSVEQLATGLQDKLAAALAVADAVIKDLITFGPMVIASLRNETLSIGEQLVQLGLREAGQQNAPLDPLGLLSKLSPQNLGMDRLIPVEFISEFTSILVSSVGRGVQQALQQTAAFVVSDSFNPRLLVEGAIQPTLMGIPVGEPPASVQMSISKRGVSYGLNVSVIRTLQLLGTAAYTGPLGLLLYSIPTAADETTIAYELPFNILDAIQGLTEGGLPLGALNPFSPEWGQLTISELSSGSSSIVVSMAQFGPGSTLLENNVQIVDDFDDPADPGKIPVTSQELLDRMLDLGGFLVTGGVLQAKLMADPFEVIQNILDAATLGGEQLEDADGELAYLFQLFSTVPAFLEAVQDSLTEMEELARVQAYLPISYATLLPQSLQQLLDGDPAAFNEAFQATFFDASGAIREDAVQAFFAALVAEIENSASTIASNMYLEGVLNGKILGIELVNGRVFAGVLPDPENPGQTVNFGNSAITVTGAIPWLGGLEVMAVLDQQLLELPAPPVTGDDPLAALRATFGDSIPMPRGSFELALDTAAEPGQQSDFEKVIAAFGLDPSLFQLPVGAQADASIRAYTPGYDLSSNDVIQRVGGLEFLANLSIPDVVDAAAFRFRATSPANGPNGTYLPFSGKASVESITLGGLTITDAVLDVVSDETGIRIAISGEAEVLGATFTVDGELNSLFQGELSLTLQTGETLANAFGGLSGEGSFTLILTGPTSGSIAFDGSLTNVPGTLSSLVVTGFIQTNDNFSLSSSATGLKLAGFTINNAIVEVVRTGSTTRVYYSGTASMSLLGTTFRASGNLSTTGVGELSMALTGSTPSFGGLSGSGTFKLLLTSATSGAVDFAGTLSSVPGKGSSTLSMGGDIYSNGNFSVESLATGVTLGGFSISNAIVEVARTGSTTRVYYSGTASMSLLGASFQASGNLSTTGSGMLSLARTSGTPKFFGYSATGSFNLNLSSATSGSMSFDGSVSNVAGGFVSSLDVSGNIQSNGTFSVSGSTSVTQTVSVVGYDVVRIVGTFSATITHSGFSGSVTGASLQQRVFNFGTGQWEWQTLATGTATINSNGTGSIGIFSFFW